MLPSSELDPPNLEPQPQITSPKKRPAEEDLTSKCHQPHTFSWRHRWSHRRSRLTAIALYLEPCGWDSQRHQLRIALSSSSSSCITGPSATAMAASRCSLLLLLLAVALAAFSGFDRADAQAAQPPLDPACQTPFQELGPCLDFASGAAASPSAQCCSGLKDVAANHLECLCELLANPGQFKINLTLALELPALCQVPVSPTACAPAATPPSGTPAPSAPSPPLPAPPTPPPYPPVRAPPSPPIPAPPVQSPPVYFPPSPAPAPSGSSTPRTSAIGSLLALAAVTLVAALL